MGVYIKNKEKPKNCYTCTFRIIDPTDGSICGCVVGHIQGIPLDQDRADDCPLEEIDLVRCGECKWWDKDGESPYGYCHAEKHCHFSSNWEISIYRKYKADHFCSDGERKNDE